jgi:hypothetical protein
MMKRERKERERRRRRREREITKKSEFGGILPLCFGSYNY